MRVAVLVEQLLNPVPGGSGRYAAELTAALARGATDADSVRTWSAWHRDLAAADIDGVGRPRRLPLPRRALSAAWQRGIGPAPRRADVVHAPTLLVPPRRGQRGELGRAGRPMVVSIHDAVPWTHPETLTPHGAQWHRAMAARAVAAGAAIATLTQAVADELHNHLSGLSADRITVLGAGVSAALRATPDAATTERVRSTFELPAAFVLSLATLEPRKGLDTALDAYALLGAAAPPLLLAGQPGWGGVAPEQLARERGVAPELVRTLGRVTDPELGVLLRAASALIMPSRAEGFGLPVAEAFAAGTPVVCSDIPALAEVAAGAALLVAPGDADGLATALTAILTDEQLRARLIEAGRRRSIAFDWDAVAARAWHLYRTLE
jgi:glycosyltransferase involved in cell wall biosynthesis